MFEGFELMPRKVCMDCGVKFSSVQVLERHKREAPQHQVTSADGVGKVNNSDDSNNVRYKVFVHLTIAIRQLTTARSLLFLRAHL